MDDDCKTHNIPRSYLPLLFRGEEPSSLYHAVGYIVNRANVSIYIPDETWIMISKRKAYLRLCCHCEIIFTVVERMIAPWSVVVEDRYRAVVFTCFYRLAE